MAWKSGYLKFPLRVGTLKPKAGNSDVDGTSGTECITRASCLSPNRRTQRSGEGCTATRNTMHIRKWKSFGPKFLNLSWNIGFQGKDCLYEGLCRLYVDKVKWVCDRAGTLTHTAGDDMTAKAAKKVLATERYSKKRERHSCNAPMRIGTIEVQRRATEGSER